MLVVEQLPQGIREMLFSYLLSNSGVPSSRWKEPFFGQVRVSGTRDEVAEVSKLVASVLAWFTGSGRARIVLYDPETLTGTIEYSTEGYYATIGA